MSLLDSLLLDPLRLDVWFALRTDGVKGTGTESDPYDVSMLAQSPLAISTISHSGRVATVTTSAPHGYIQSEFPVVIIAGVTGSGASQFNGRFSIINASGSTFQYAMLQTPAGSAGVTSDTKCTRVSFPVDQLMFEVVFENTTVHLGPGVIEARGFSQTWGGWFARSGQKIIGSGIDVTILKIVHGYGAESATPNNALQYYAIGTAIDANIEDFEASDFTVDCNLGGQPVMPDASYFSPVLCGAIYVGGSRIRIRRVRAINWGTQNSLFENFVLFTGGASPVVGDMTDCVIEDCILEQPSMNITSLVSCIGIAGGGERGVVNRGCVVRNCVVDCRYKVDPVAITSITYSGSTAMVTTAAPHGRGNNDWVRIAGAFMKGSAVNPYNGSFQITNVASTTFQYTMPSIPTAPPAGDLWLDHFPSHLVKIRTVTQIDNPTNLYEIETYTPHYRIPGETVSPNRIKVPSGYSIVYNGLFQVYAVISPTKFQYKLLTSPEAYPPDLSEAATGWQYHAIGADAGTGGVQEGNRVYGSYVGHYNDTGSSKDVVIRNNYYYDAVCGICYGMGRVGAATHIASGQSITYDLATNIATFSTPVVHGLQPNSAVQILGATINNGQDPPGGTYNGFYEVLDAPTSTTFRYQMGSNPGSNADQNTGQYAEYWRIQHLVVENNVIELTPTLPGIPESFGILLSDYVALTSLAIYLQSVIRGNVIREMNDASDPSSYGIGLVKCENAIVEQNVIDPAVGTPIVQNLSGILEYFGNSTPAGLLLQGYDQQQSRKVDEITTRVEESLLVSI